MLNRHRGTLQLLLTELFKINNINKKAVYYVVICIKKFIKENVIIKQ